MSKIPQLASSVELKSGVRCCRKCKQTKPLDDFPKHSKSRNARRTFCKSCHARNVQDCRARNPERSITVARNGYARDRAAKGFIPRSEGIYARFRREYTAWKSMKVRCLYPSAGNYAYYGGRGIKVCARWLASFADFLADVGPRPGVGYSLDRINVNGNYEPGNCRWATHKEQAHNRRKRRDAIAGA